MLLRKTLEKYVPVSEGEEHLSELAREVIFRGTYFWPQEIVNGRTHNNNYAKTRDAYPYMFTVTREYSDGTKHFTGNQSDSRYWKEPIYMVEEEIHTPAKLRRANRIERIGRRLKLAAGLLAAVGVASLAVTTGHESFSDDTPVIEPCAEFVDGGETLIAVTSEQSEQFATAGQTVCELSGVTFTVIE